MDFENLKQTLSPDVVNGFTKEIIQKLSDEDIIECYIVDADTNKYIISYPKAIKLAAECSTFDDWWQKIISTKRNKNA
jgi:hypothetical protein